MGVGGLHHPTDPDLPTIEGRVEAQHPGRTVRRGGVGRCAERARAIQNLETRPGRFRWSGEHQGERTERALDGGAIGGLGGLEPRVRPRRRHSQNGEGHEGDDGRGDELADESHDDLVEGVGAIGVGSEAVRLGPLGGAAE